MMLASSRRPSRSATSASTTSTVGGGKVGRRRTASVNAERVPMSTASNKRLEDLSGGRVRSSRRRRTVKPAAALDRARPAAGSTGWLHISALAHQRRSRASRSRTLSPAGGAPACLRPMRSRDFVRVRSPVSAGTPRKSSTDLGLSGGRRDRLSRCSRSRFRCTLKEFFGEVAMECARKDIARRRGFRGCGKSQYCRPAFSLFERQMRTPRSHRGVQLIHRPSSPRRPASTSTICP